MSALAAAILNHTTTEIQKAIVRCHSFFYFIALMAGKSFQVTMAAVLQSSTSACHVNNHDNASRANIWCIKKMKTLLYFSHTGTSAIKQLLPFKSSDFKGFARRSSCLQRVCAVDTEKKTRLALQKGYLLICFWRLKYPSSQENLKRQRIVVLGVMFRVDKLGCNVHGRGAPCHCCQNPKTQSTALPSP